MKSRLIVPARDKQQVRILIALGVSIAFTCAARDAAACTDAGVCSGEPVLPASGELPLGGSVFFACDFNVTRAVARSGTTSIEVDAVVHRALVEVHLPPIGPELELDLFNGSDPAPFRTISIRTSSSADTTPPPSATLIESSSVYETRGSNASTCDVERTGYWVSLTALFPPRDPPHLVFVRAAPSAPALYVSVEQGSPALIFPDFFAGEEDGQSCYWIELADLGGNRSTNTQLHCINLQRSPDAGVADAGARSDASPSNGADPTAGCSCSAQNKGAPLALLLVAALAAIRRRL